MSKEVRIAKGVTIKGQVQHTYLPALTGVQMKVGIDTYNVTGVVRHIRTDVATPNPGIDHIALLVDPEEGYKGPLTTVPGCRCGNDHALVKLRGLIDVLGDPIPLEQAVLIIDIKGPEEGP